MDDIRKERLIVFVATVAGLSCIIQNFLGGWELWVPVVVLVGTLAIWWFHIAQKLDEKSRVNIYFIYSAFLVFYHGIHESSLYEISIAVLLCMAAFSIAERLVLLDWIIAEYVVVMAIQFYYIYRDSQTDIGAFDTMKLAFHIGSVVAMYIFNRINVNHRIGEKSRQLEWKQKVKESDHDMEDFLSNISHELRTPVNVISGMTTLLQKDIDRNELVSIQEAGIRLAHQIEDIQDYTEIKRGELVLEEENYM